MKDIFGYDMKVGSLVLGCNTTTAIKSSTLGILVGENEVFKCDEKGYKRVYKYKNIVNISVDTDEKKDIYNKLVEEYKNYQYKEYSLLSNYSYYVNIGDVLKIKSYGKRVYMGYCSVREFDPQNHEKLKEGYLYISYRFISDLKDELNSKSKNITYKAILKRLFLNNYGSDYYIMSNKPLEYVEKSRPFEILGRLTNFHFERYYRYEIDYDSYKSINFVLDDEGVIDERDI